VKIFDKCSLIYKLGSSNKIIIKASKNNPYKLQEVHEENQMMIFRISQKFRFHALENANASLKMQYLK